MTNNELATKKARAAIKVLWEADKDWGWNDKKGKKARLEYHWLLTAKEVKALRDFMYSYPDLVPKDAEKQ